MKKTTQALSVTLALFLTCAGVVAKEPCKCKKCNQERVQVYAHPSLMNADATEVKDANSVYRIGGKVLKQKNRLGFTNKDNIFVIDGYMITDKDRYKLFESKTDYEEDSSVGTYFTIGWKDKFEFTGNANVTLECKINGTYKLKDCVLVD